MQFSFGKGVLKICLMLVLVFQFKLSNAQCPNAPSWTPTHETCPNSNDGTICCNTNGGPIPSCSIIPWPAGVLFSGSCFTSVPPDVYDVTSTFPGCPPVTVQVEVYENTNAPMVLSVTNVQNPTCGLANGSACLSVTGGGPGITYLWDTNSLFTPPITSPLQCPSNLGAIQYYAAATYINSWPDGQVNTCRNFIPVSLTPINLSLSATLIHSDCATNCNGAIDLTPNGTAPYSYTWSNGATTEDLTGLCAGNYTVNVTDANGCTGTAAYTITLNGADVFIGGTGFASNIIFANTVVNWTPANFQNQTQIIVDADVIVQAGATLNIIGLDVRFTPGHALRAMNSTGTAQPAHIDGNNSFFDVICGDTWRGFEILGTGVNTPQDNRATLNLANNCEVRHAECGIRNYQPGPPPGFGPISTSTGGLITCANTLFIDNVQDLKLLNFYQNGTGNGNPCATFTSCEFRLTPAGIPAPRESTLNAIEANWPRIHLQKVVDVNFFDCVLNNLNLNYGNTVRIQGLVSDQSDFSWSGTDPTIPITAGSYTARVYGFRMGFWVRGGALTNNENANIAVSCEINNTYFQSWNCIYTSAVKVVRIHDNWFDPLDFNAGYINTSTPADVAGPMFVYFLYPAPLPIPPFYPTTNGVVAMDYEVAGNEFNSIDPAKRFVGIHAVNTGAHDNYIFGNTFTSCSKAIDFNGRHRENYLLQDAGSHVECNDFITCLEDIYIRNSANAPLTHYGIGRFQENYSSNPPILGQSAGNNFVPSFVGGNGFDDIEFIGTPPAHSYNYVVGELNGGAAPNEVDPGMTLVPVLTSHQCDWIYDVNVGGNQNMMAQASSNYEALKAAYELMEDGGNTDALKQEVLESSFYDALQLYQTLSQVSPALSDEVVLATIANEVALPNVLLTAIITMNPEAAKSAYVREALDSKSTPLTEYQMLQIEAARQQVSPKEIVHKQMAFQLASMQRQKDAFCRNATNVNDAIAVLEEDRILQDRLKEADLLYRSGQMETAFAMLQSTGTTFNLQPEDALEIDKYVNYLSVENAILTRAETVITTEEETYLLSLWENDPFNLGILASNLLNAYAGYDLVLYIPDEPMGEQRSSRISSTPVQPMVSVYPNPSTHFIVVRSEDVKPATIKLMQTDGKIVLKTTVDAMQNETIVNLEDIDSGLYILVLYGAEDEVLYQTTIAKK
jgi:Secretion system C-terminal sorting domain/SprB repeat